MVGSDSLFIGTQAGYTNRTGQVNVFIGSNAGYSNYSGSGNLFLGQQAGYFSTGSYNLFMGNGAGSRTTSVSGDTAVGDGALLRNETGIHNVAIGRYAGVESRGDENVFIGFAADAGNNVTNATAIGPRARVSQSNSIVLGADANVGIGTSSSRAKLHVVGPTGQSGLRLENLPISATATGGQTKFLTVDKNGNVILGTAGSGGESERRRFCGNALVVACCKVRKTTRS